MRDGKQGTRTYGCWPGMSLLDARKANIGFRVEPVVKAIPTFQSVVQEWLKIKLPTLSNAKHQLQVENTLERYVFPAIAGVLLSMRYHELNLLRWYRLRKRGGIETAH